MAFLAGGTNRSLSASPPSEYLARIVAEQGEQALAAHCIPTDPSLWTVEAYRSFLDVRRDALARAVNEFIDDGQPPSATVNVEALIAGGEGDTLEFKSSARWDYRQGAPDRGMEAVVVKTVGGFMNARGGQLLIGVADDGSVVGLEADYKTLGKRPDRDGYQQFLVNLLSSALGKEACARLRISFRPVRGLEVCLVEVDRSPKPVFHEDGQNSRFYVRMASTTQVLNAREAVGYIKSQWPE